MYKKLNSGKHLLFLLACVAILMGSLQSCLKDNFDDINGVDYRPAIAMPLFNSSLALKDMIHSFDSGGFVQVDPSSHLLSLVYVNSFNSPYAEKLFSIPSQTYAKQIGMTAADTVTFLANTNISLPYKDTVKFSFPNNTTAKIMNILLKSGSMDLSINSTFEHSGVLTFTFPTVKKSGLAFTKTVPINYVNGPVVITNNYDLTGYNFDLTAGGTVTNSLPVDIKLDMTYKAGNHVFPGDKIDLNVGLNNFNFSFMDGYLGTLPFPATHDTLGIDFFNNSLPGGTGSISFFDPKLTVEIENSFGLPVAVNFSKLKAFNSQSSLLLSGSAPILSGPVSVSYPSASQIGQVAKSSYFLDKNNSNIDKVFNSGPTGMEYAMSLTSNPGGGTPYNFIVDTSRFKLNLKAELPMWGTMKKFVFVDTLDMELNVGDEVNSVTFKINTDNGFPLDCDLQIYFTDSTLARIDSLTVPGQNIIASAVVNSVGDVLASTHKTTTVVMDEKRFSYVKQKSARALVVAKLITTAGGTKDVKILSTYRLGVQLGLLLNLKVGK